MPLTITSDKGHSKTMEVLLAHKFNVNAKDKVSQGVRCECAPTGLGTHGLGVGVWGQGSAMA